jgi:PPOX class probable FMN-dependent enzyme
MPFDHSIDDIDGLRQLYADPHPQVIAKAIDHVDDKAAGFIAKAPFVVLATASDRGTDASPRGGPPGFVAVIDERRIAIGDLAGNRRLDSFENLLANPAVGLLFLIPGMAETLRVNGRATLTTDPAVLDACAFDGTQPKMALGVDVDEVFLHCAKAFRRSGLWDPETWPTADERPRPGAIWRDHLKLEVSADVIEKDLEQGYALSMWQAGGEDAPDR